jgi:hypothetical protein
MNSVRFTCQRGCINCCTMQGYVYLTEDDLKRAAAFTRMTARAFGLIDGSRDIKENPGESA